MEQSANGHTPARVYLQPLAAPSILGLYGFTGATLILASHMAGWWGDSQITSYIWPFAAAFGGVAQFVAGMWTYKARDAIVAVAEFVGSPTGTGWAELSPGEV